MPDFNLTIEGHEPFAGNLEIQTAPSYQLYRLRKWGDPIMVSQAGLDVNVVRTTNFQAIGLFNKETGWGGVTNFLNIPRGDINRLIAMQVEDEFKEKRPEPGAWLTQKMNWLFDEEKGSIYFRGDWKTSESVRWGTIGLGGNVVAVEGVEELFVATRGDTRKRWRNMGRLAGFRKTDWSRLFDDKGVKVPNFEWELQKLVRDGLVHLCNCAYYPNNVFGPSPKGVIYSPFWSPLDWDFSGTLQPQAFYVCMDWLEAV